VKASDYAIGKFKYLKTLLFIHGRESYRRNSYATTYVFYKNILETAPIFYFGISSIFSGTMFYHSMLYTAYNVVFTAFPVIWYATMDLEYEKVDLMTKPDLYKYGIRNLHFNIKVFIKWIADAFWQSFLILMFAYFVVAHDTVNRKG